VFEQRTRGNVKDGEEQEWVDQVHRGKGDKLSEAKHPTRASVVRGGGEQRKDGRENLESKNKRVGNSFPAFLSLRLWEILSRTTPMAYETDMTFVCRRRACLDGSW
jgi:hypothetical protein